MPLAAALERAGLTEGFAAQVREAATLVRSMAADFGPDVPAELNQAKTIATRLRDHMVLVYGAGSRHPPLGAGRPRSTRTPRRRPPTPSCLNSTTTR